MRHVVDADGLVRSDEWFPGTSAPIPDLTNDTAYMKSTSWGKTTLEAILDRAIDGTTPSEEEIIKLFSARGKGLEAICKSADQLRYNLVGDSVSYIVNRNINYTNICYFKC